MKFITKSIIGIGTSILMLFSGVLYAQQNADAAIDPSDSSKLFTSSIQLITRSFKDSVVLRWAPNRAGAWAWANKVGYVVERVTFKADSTFDLEEFIKLTKQPIKPWPLDDWQKIIDPENPNPYAAVAAQTLYGESFSTGGILEQADDFKNRFSFSLLAADVSPETATALGLRFTDNEVEPNKNYIYRVYVAQPSNYYKTDTAYAVVNAGDVQKLPEVAISEVQEHELRVNLLWDRNLYESVYSAYYIEKSTDGKKFTRLNKLPYINAISNDFKGNKNTIIYSDSLTQNYKPHFYRVIGISPFGELSTSSKVVKAMGRDRTPPTPPSNIKAEHLGGSRVQITWEKQVKEPDLKGFVIGRSQDAGKGFQPLFTEPLGVNQTSFIDENALEKGTNYYLVAALDTAGNGSSSLVSYAMIVDSLPPAPPQNLTGKVDTSGVVTLTWDLGPESDIAGYMIYFSNAREHVFSTLNKRPWQDSVYVDTIQVMTLTEEIFYVIKAVDVTYNYSNCSDTLRLIRPDLIAPSSPVFSDYQVTEQGIMFSWVPSSSEDVVKYNLLRKQSEGFEIILEIPADSAKFSYKDTTVVSGKIYSYSLVAVDDAGLKSAMAQALTIKMPDLKTKPSVQNISLISDVEHKVIRLSWQYDVPEDYRLVLYKAIDGGNFLSYKSLEADVHEFTDYNTKDGKLYEYVFKVQFKNGKTSPFGKIVKGGI